LRREQSNTNLTKSRKTSVFRLRFVN
jgi:hypothetical protein